MLSFKNIALLFAAYAVVQVTAQDLGIKISKIQKNIVQYLPFQIALLYATAYSVTENPVLALVVVGFYYILKYIFGNPKYIRYLNIHQ